MAAFFMRNWQLNLALIISVLLAFQLFFSACVRNVTAAKQRQEAFTA